MKTIKQIREEIKNDPKELLKRIEQLEKEVADLKTKATK